MAKIKEREVAKRLFVDLGKTQKEIAEDLGVTAKTIGEWVKDGNWKAERSAVINNSKNRSEKFKAVLEDFADEQLMLNQQIKDAEATGDLIEAARLRKVQASLADQVGKYQKALERIDKENKISLSTRIEILEDIFNEMQEYDKDLFMKSLDFQKYYLQKTAQNHG
ncbi:hypothetical protein [Flavobacterium beibuense]|uniref:hypothetical protein n=1 Tax=Flavobacterium beibuense TaxID=657326 RepID=UPI003A8F0240